MMRQQYCIVNRSIKNLPAVIDKVKESTRKSVRKKRVSDQDGTTDVVPISKKDDKMRRLNEDNLTIRTLVLQETTVVDGAYLKSGSQINIDDARKRVDQAETLIRRNITLLIRRQ